MLPADPLRDHRGRHRRSRLQQLPDLRLDRINPRTPRDPDVLRRRIPRQCTTNSIPRDPQLTRDRLDRHPLRPVQPTDLSPVLHCHHPSQGHARGSLSTVARGSVFTRRRQLSRLAEPQPDLDEPRTLENRALFLRVSEILREVLLECQARVFAGPPDWWLLKLVGILHHTNTTTITFNYDTLIESTIDASRLFDADLHRVRGSHLLRGLPPLRLPDPGGLRFGPARASTFRYLKLHGSLDTFWIPNDVTGATIGRLALQGGWGRPTAESDDRRRELLPGTSPFIVPPAATKSAFYGNPLTRELWQSTARELGDADEVALIGYSLPATDLVSSGMFADTLAQDTRVTVVNPSPDLIVHRLVDLGVSPDDVTTVDGDGCVQSYVNRLESELRPPFDAGVPGDVQLAIGTGGREHAVIGPIHPTDHGVIRLAAASIHSDAGRDPDLRVTLKEILHHGPIRTIEIDYGDGRISAVASTRVAQGPSGAPEYVVLTPTVIPQDLPSSGN